MYGCDVPSVGSLRGRAHLVTSSGAITQRIAGNSARVAIRCAYVLSPVNNNSDYALIGVLVGGTLCPFAKLIPQANGTEQVTIADVGDLITQPLFTWSPSGTSGTISVIEVEYVPEGFE